MKLKNQTAIISGASQGLGFVIAKLFAQQGANLMLCARDEAKLLQAQKELQAISTINKIAIQAANVADANAMEKLAKRTYDLFGRIDILIANAGIYGTKGALETVDIEEWSNAIDINLKGSVWQCRAVLPYLKQRNYGKIIFLSGGGATRPMPYLSAYAASKAGLVRFAETLAEETEAFHIDVNALAPGGLNTNMLEEILSAGPEKVGAEYFAQAVKQKENGGASLETAAELCLFLASKESDGVTGRLISAVWDPWQKLTNLKEQLRDSDIYTIRRILPKDRGYDWGDPL